MPSALEKLRPIAKWLLLSSFVMFLIGAVVGVITVRSAGYPDWYIHVAMWAVLGAYFLIAGQSMLRGKRVGMVANLVLFWLFAGFWVHVLSGMIPGKDMLLLDAEGNGVWTNRESLDVLWASVAILVVAALDLLFVLVVCWNRGETVLPASASPTQPVPVEQTGSSEGPHQEI